MSNVLDELEQSLRPSEVPKKDTLIITSTQLEEMVTTNKYNLHAVLKKAGVPSRRLGKERLYVTDDIINWIRSGGPRERRTRTSS